MITFILARFPLSSEKRSLGGGGYFTNFWVGMCHWDPEPLAGTKISSAQFCYSLPQHTGLKLFLEKISLYLVSR